MIDRFLYWGNHVEAKSDKITGSCQLPLGGNYGLQSSRLLHVASLEKLMQFCPEVITLRETLELGNRGKPDVPNLVLNSSVNHLGHVTSKGLVTV